MVKADLRGMVKIAETYTGWCCSGMERGQRVRHQSRQAKPTARKLERVLAEPTQRLHRRACVEGMSAEVGGHVVLGR